MQLERFHQVSILLGLGVLVWARLAAAQADGKPDSPAAVSPGDPTRMALVEARCPTFSWGSVEGAGAFELAVYRAAEESGAQEPVLWQSFPGSVTSWTPSLDRCLERGERYAWSVRALGAEEVSSWSRPSLFEVTSESATLELADALSSLRRVLEERPLYQPSRESVRAGEPSASAVSEKLPAPPPSAAAVVAYACGGDPALSVNGAAVVTTKTLAVAVGVQQCRALGNRYVDLGNGTILDCNTCLIWLKDASCADLQGTTPDGRANWDTAQSAAAALANGTCGLTDGSSPGDWRQPMVSELCGAWSGSVLTPCPAGASSEGLMNTNFMPAVSNAKGDAVWQQGDAFDHVLSTLYWSATPYDATNAWGVDLGSGNVFINATGAAVMLNVWPVRGGN